MSVENPNSDDRAGMDWWNSLGPIDRAWWLGRAGSARPVDAWRKYQRDGSPEGVSSV